MKYQRFYIMDGYIGTYPDYQKPISKTACLLLWVSVILFVVGFWLWVFSVPAFAFEGCRFITTVQGIFQVCCQQGVCIATR